MPHMIHLCEMINQRKNPLRYNSNPKDAPFDEDHDERKCSAPIGKFKTSSNASLRGKRAISGQRVVQRWKVRPIG